MSDRTSRRIPAGVFDIRFIIGALLGIYGVILLIVAFFVTTDADIEKAGSNVNLWTGLGLLASAAFFAVWAALRPLAVPVPDASTQTGTQDGPGTGTGTGTGTPDPR